MSLKRNRNSPRENWVGDYSAPTRPNHPPPDRPTHNNKTAPAGPRSLLLGRPTGVGGRTDDHPCGRQNQGSGSPATARLNSANSGA